MTLPVGTPGWTQVLTGPDMFTLGSGSTGIGSEVGRQPNLCFQYPLSVSPDPLNHRNVVSVNETTVNQTNEINGKAATSGNATTLIMSTALATGSIAGLIFSFTATDGTYTFFEQSTPLSGLSTLSGMLTSIPSEPMGINSFPISPVGASTAWSPSLLGFNVQGPQATVNLASAGVSGSVRLTVKYNVGSGSSAPPTFNPAVNGESLTISGLSTCTEANGVHICSFVDPTHVDLPAVVLVHSGSDSGTIIETSPRTLSWGGTAWVGPIAP